ncbi:protein NRT1/ PTR FAMILY 6.3-like [Olea europaea var. sylvestris]|uniref:protein NRT1/ PTR FAMILY 6.3-like n=1 Tax=Olea europaea var. sylvestris TaxID=158386 RepID=UPI000C1D21CD|nr:protein NRT1/ PTR FAMILY 6.3-like [Olea europaea var. sylvestris]
MALPETEQEAAETLPDAWDYKGRPALKSSSGGWGCAAMILGVEVCERLTTLGIAVNLVTYLTANMHLGNASSANTVTNFLGTSFMLCLLGGFVADTFLGRYLTIGIFATVQAMGVTILTISTIIPSLRPPKCSPGRESCIPASGMQLVVLYIALYLTALGTGGLKSSVSGFGSDQFEDSDKKEREQMTKFFNWFFFFISIGSLAAVTVLVYVQDNLGREWGYGICACAIVFGIVVFLAGTRRYRFKKLVGSPLTQIASVFVAAWRKRHIEPPSDPSLLYNVDDIEVNSKKKKQKLMHSKEFRFLDNAAIKDPEISVVSKWYLSTLTDVEEVKLVARMLPAWATTIMFWTVYAQMTTFSVSQATTMDRHIGKSFQIPAASLTVFFVGSILLTVPIYDRIIVPICRRIIKNPHGLAPLQRIGVGLVLSILAMVAAALTEIKRLDVARKHGLTNDPMARVPLSVFWLVPQFFLVGAGEAFTYIGQLDFFLRECPKGMKTMSTGLFLSTLSLGFFFSSILVTIVHKVTGDKKPWLADNLNQGKLYDFYWLLAILSVLNFIIYMVSAKGYVYKEKRLAEEGIELEETDGPSCH